MSLSLSMCVRGSSLGQYARVVAESVSPPRGCSWAEDATRGTEGWRPGRDSEADSCPGGRRGRYGAPGPRGWTAATRLLMRADLTDCATLGSAAARGQTSVAQGITGIFYLLRRCDARCFLHRPVRRNYVAPTGSPTVTAMHCARMTSRHPLVRGLPISADSCAGRSSCQAGHCPARRPAHPSVICDRDHMFGWCSPYHSAHFHRPFDHRFRPTQMA